MFSWFSCDFKQMLRRFPKFQLATRCLSCKIKPICRQSHQNFFFQIIYNSTLIHKIRIPRPRVSSHYLHLQFQTVLIRKANGRSLGTFQQNYATSSSPHLKSSVSHFSHDFSLSLILLLYFLLVSLQWTLPMSLTTSILDADVQGCCLGTHPPPSGVCIYVLVKWFHFFWFQSTDIHITFEFHANKIENKVSYCNYGLD
jgi:hypothetical protein